MYAKQADIASHKSSLKGLPGPGPVPDRLSNRKWSAPNTYISATLNIRLVGCVCVCVTVMITEEVMDLRRSGRGHGRIWGRKRGGNDVNTVIMYEIPKVNFFNLWEDDWQASIFRLTQAQEAASDYLTPTLRAGEA